MPARSKDENGTWETVFRAQPERGEAVSSFHRVPISATGWRSCWTAT